MDPGWLSNGYLVYDEPGGTAVFVDSGGPLDPLIEEIVRERLEPTHLLITHGHADHVAGNDELERLYGLTPTQDGVETGGLRFEALPSTGHSSDGVAFYVNGEAVFSADTLFKDAVGGSLDDFEGVRRSVMDVLMALPHETRVHPGHTDPTTIGDEWERNAFVRLWRGLDEEGTEPCKVWDQEATLVLWAPDYDGGHKAWVRWPDGRDDIVPGSQVSRG